MFLLTLKNKREEGVYAVDDQYGNLVLFLFQEEDDATRYAMMLEDDGGPEMHVIEVEDDIMLKTCELHDCKYTIITKNDLVIPPEVSHDFI